MNPNARTPSILVTLGRCSRLFNLYLTTAPSALDAPSTITLHTAPLVHIAVLADVSLPLDAADGQVASRLVLVDSLELDWQRTRLRPGGFRLIGADPFLFGPDSLEKWLWQRLQALPPDAFGNKTDI
jgi:hypothetical protein